MAKGKMAALCGLCAAGWCAAGDVSFAARTVPETTGLTAAVTVRREGDVWHLTTTARNGTATNVTFKLVLAAEPGFAATRYLIPGVNYNGSLELAYKMVDRAKAAGADIVKFQTGVPEKVMSRFAEKAEYHCLRF